MNKETQLLKYLQSEYPDYTISVISTGWYGYFETRYLVQMIDKDDLDIYLQFRFIKKWEVYTEKTFWWGILLVRDCGDNHAFTIELINTALNKSKEKRKQWKEPQLEALAIS